MGLTIVEEPPTAATFKAYTSLPMAFEVDLRFRGRALRPGGRRLHLVLEPVTPSYIKD